MQRLAASLAGLGEHADRRVSRRQAEQLDSEGLTRREVGVVQLLAVGRTNREIAAELHIEERTVKAYVGRLMRKTGADNRIKLSMLALNLSLVPPQRPALASEDGTAASPVSRE